MTRIPTKLKPWFEARRRFKLSHAHTQMAYLLIQRQFETSDGGRCYIETHDEKYIGHFLLRRVEFTPERLSIEFDRPSEVSCGKSRLERLIFSLVENTLFLPT